MLKADQYNGPLAGLKVLDFGHYYAGPMVGMLLADQGADVIRVVRPGQSELPPAQYRVFNRNKKLLMLDLKTKAGRTQAKSLIDRADVLIENFRPGVMKRLGIDYPSLKEANPGLVYLSLPGFASTDSARAHLQAWEGVMNAATGLYTDVSDFRKYLKFPPVYSWVPLSSVYGAMTGAIAVLAALVDREADGVGALIETPLAEAGAAGFGSNYAFTSGVNGFHFRVRDASTVRNEHEAWPKQRHNEYSVQDTRGVQWDKLTRVMRLTWSTGPILFYRCADGREVNLNFSPGRLMENMMRGLGIHRQLLDEGYTYRGTWNHTPTNLDSPWTMSAERQRRLRELICAVMVTKTAEDWERLLGEGSCVAKIRTRAEWMELEPMLRSGVFAKMHDGTSEIATPGRFIDVGGPGESLFDKFCEPQRIEIPEASRLFSPTRPHSRTKPQPGIAKKKGELLRGLKVLDLSNGLAGPTSAFTLAQYGAEVIKLDPPLLLLPQLINLCVEVNQGKRSILIDLKTMAGQDVLRRIVSWADVVVHNTLDDVATRLGIDAAQLRAINPNVIACQVSCLGGSHRGYWELRPGFDPIAQQVSGLMSQYGTLEQPHQHGMTLTTDNLGGFGAALGALVGVLQRERNGVVGEARCSLARVANYIQFPYMITEHGSNDWGEARGQFSVGVSWWNRFYACSDGWLYVDSTRGRRDALRSLVTGDESSSEADMEDAFAKRDCSHWLSQLGDAGIASHPVVSVSDICEGTSIRTVGNEEADEVARGAGEILCWEDHPSGVALITKAPDWVRVGEEFSWKRLSPAPRFGFHTREILVELGYSEADADELIRQGVAHEYVPAMAAREDYFYAPRGVT